MTILGVIDEGSFPLHRWDLRQPMIGVWRASVRIAAIVTAGATFILTDETNEWHGVARAVIPDGAFTRCEVVGGTGKLESLTKERFYAFGVEPRSVLADLAIDVGEVAASDALSPLPQWRTRGNSARNEIETLARYTTGAYRMTPGGEVSLVIASGESDPPGVLISAAHDGRIYESKDLLPMAGLTVDGVRVDTAIYSGGQEERVTTALWAQEALGRGARPGAVGGKVLSYANGRVDVELDTGLVLGSLPLWSSAGVVPWPQPGARVLVTDLADDPRTTVAYCGAFDGEVSRLDLAQGGVPDLADPLTLIGRVVRYGDSIMMPTGAPATPTATVVTYLGPPIPVSKVRA